MENYEELLKWGIENIQEKEYNGVFGVLIPYNNRQVLETLKEKGLIKNLTISNHSEKEIIVSFDITNSGMNYFK